MILRYGDMFANRKECHLLLATGNNALNSVGELIMGAGAAKQLKEIYPFLPNSLGVSVRKNPEYRLLTRGAKVAEHPLLVGVFQTKRYFASPSDVMLIQESTIRLFSEIVYRWSSWTIFLNYPGIGYGGLSESQVAPIIQLLPDNVHIWRNDE